MTTAADGTGAPSRGAAPRRRRGGAGTRSGAAKAGSGDPQAEREGEPDGEADREDERRADPQAERTADAQDERTVAQDERSADPQGERAVRQADREPDPQDERTVPQGHPAVPLLPPSSVRLFGSTSFFRLWLAQVASSLGDWVGLVAVIAIAARVGGSSPEAAVGLVLSARLVPGFFLGPAAGVLVDRLDRKRVMVVCDVGRGLVFASLPFVDTLLGLVAVSLLLEILTQLWSPAKEASVPNLVPASSLTTANSLGLVAAYGTFPIGSAVFAALAGVAKWLGSYEPVSFLRVDQESLAIVFDVATFFVSAVLISTLALPRQPARPAGSERRTNLGRALVDLRDGFRFIGRSRLVRAVILGIATGLVGGGMLVPLGPPFASQVLGGGSAAFGLLLTALGTGLAVGIVGLSLVQRRVPHERTFVISVFGAGACILAGASMSTLTPALVLVALLGVFAGAVYVLGVTLLQSSVDDVLRGRIFATFNTLTRFCLLLAFTIAPFLSSLLDGLSARLFDRSVEVGGVAIALPGVRVTLWLGGLIILAAGFLALVSLRHPAPAE